mmetsp:Transcript_12679/g.16079  ORF Transcript_12679/g.16079 Transcript_12679/m.16079 type:complete len:329 (-) Transcript_12679:265-1251(-)|eukprot:CAMPEP_0203637738 /NCGR_PEP_ID=MMETSP0088-20131115/3979_1 /ASSEMBLY_ACC=CAM_ASM_001087 /TAXON_ID=426623 /ORGANISM="Chaetoceros affinis, Strain CCMP159" /LENGTH=328 /DNA_ID=CAMNT_0050492245 /DNA_START=197 /DNA_END=1183 /DNA_ORIENTATION=+
MDKFNIPVVKKPVEVIKTHVEAVKNMEAPVTITENLVVTVDNGMMPILGNFCAAVVLLVATINSTTNGSMEVGMRGYANSVAVVAMVLSFLLLTGIKQVLRMSFYIRYVLFFWCFIGGCILTFGTGPFSSTGNGYFCSWALAIFSFMNLGFSYDTMKSTILKNATPLISLAFCSFVLLMATIPWAGSQIFFWETIFAIAITILTMAIIGFLFYKHQRSTDIPGSSFHIVLFLAILWIFTAGIVTFRGPFLITGNGYFSAWAGAIFASVAAKEVHSDEDDGIEATGQGVVGEDGEDVDVAPPQPRLASPREPVDDETVSRTAVMTRVSV